MALTTTEEAQLRELIAQQAALLSLASSESTIISKLGATKATLSDLTAATTLTDADLFLVRQGTTDKSATGTVIKALTNVSATEGAAGALELATASEVRARTAGALAVTPSNIHNSPAACKAWVSFAGATGTIQSSYNVTSVTREAAGQYLITFTDAMQNANYAWAGSSGETNGVTNGAGAPGGNNHVSGTGATGSVSLKTTTQLRVFNYEAGSVTASEDASAISVIVFGA